MAKLKFGDTGSCPAMYPTQEGGKFGLTIDNFVGNVTNRVLSAPSTTNGITFSGVTEIGSAALNRLMYYRDIITGQVSFPSVILISDFGLNEAFSSNQITSVNLSSLTTVGSHGLKSSFSSNQITSVNLSSLTTVGDYGLSYAFNSNQITSVNLSALTTVGESGLDATFYNNQITSVNLSALTTVGDYGLNTAFSENQITSVNLSALTTVGSYGLSNAFGSQRDYNNQTTLTSISLPALTSSSFESDDESAFNNMIYNNDGVTVHFPSNLQNVIGNWQSVIDGFGGTNTTVLFDLPSTAVSNGNSRPGGDDDDYYEEL